MKKKLITIFLPFLILFSVSLTAKTEYKIECEFTGETDSLVILANYYGNTFQIIDTFKVINQTAVFSGTGTINQGVYTIARLNKSKYFDFIIGDKPFFHIRVNTKNITDSISTTDSPDNSYFFNYIKLNSKLYQIDQKTKQTNTKKLDKEDLHREKELILSNLQLLKKNVRLKTSGSILDIIFRSMEEPAFPSHILSDDKKKYQYYKSNYWNLVALDDNRLLRTPVFHRKFEHFFDRIILQHPDTIIYEIDKLFEKEIDPEIFKYLIWDLTLKYENPKIMGLDKVFVHIIDNYYKKNKIKDISQGIIDNIIERGEKIRPLLINKIAPNLIMVDTLGSFDALNNYATKEFTVVLFWESDCQSCQEEIKKLQTLYHSSKFDMQVFAVGTDSNIESWKEYIRKHNLDWINVNGTKSITQDYHNLYNIYSTPTIFILDKHNRIIGKKISVDQLEGFLNNYKKKLKTEKLN